MTCSDASGAVVSIPTLSSTILMTSVCATTGDGARKAITAIPTAEPMKEIDLMFDSFLSAAFPGLLFARSCRFE